MNFLSKISDIDGGVVEMVKVTSEVLIFLIKSFDDLFSFSVFVS